ncbi:uncharacterized protein [Anabrus simplex]|uniref:uncharacterized protein n=1 Tax=Anabrus simplex TaxID=316456 RepID=UPI0034DCF8FD
MGVGPVSSTLVFTGLVLVFLAKEAEGVKCYICSWSPYDNSNDTCRPEYFNPDRVVVHECSKGCETVSMKDKNGEIEMFYRNCYTRSDENYAYSKKDTRLNEEEVQRCNYKLCNEAVTTQATVALTVTIASLLLFVSCRLL